MTSKKPDMAGPARSKTKKTAIKTHFGKRTHLCQNCHGKIKLKKKATLKSKKPALKDVAPKKRGRRTTAQVIQDEIDLASEDGEHDEAGRPKRTRAPVDYKLTSSRKSKPVTEWVQDVTKRTQEHQHDSRPLDTGQNRKSPSDELAHVFTPQHMHNEPQRGDLILKWIERDGDQAGEVDLGPVHTLQELCYSIMGAFNRDRTTGAVNVDRAGWDALHVETVHILAPLDGSITYESIVVSRKWERDSDCEIQRLKDGMKNAWQVAGRSGSGPVVCLSEVYMDRDVT